ncbi:MAG TPA: hypothetical protein DEP20_03080 [Fusobacteria bacterium]|nr:hypothetical protein [Fusobacteriota bacterium]|tara:strand:- start:11418 stop:11681 length:264 start_codon:yes stop_codon:yes gene_type:complete
MFFFALLLFSCSGTSKDYIKEENKTLTKHVEELTEGDPLLVKEKLNRAYNTSIDNNKRIEKLEERYDTKLLEKLEVRLRKLEEKLKE